MTLRGLPATPGGSPRCFGTERFGGLKCRMASSSRLNGGHEAHDQRYEARSRRSQAADWGGLSWSGWLDFDKAHRGHLIPATPGIYRSRARDEPGLLYIGESGEAGGRRARLDDLARGRKRHPASFYLHWRAAGLAKGPHRGHYAAPYMRQCEDAGCHVEVSWALAEHPEKTEQRAVEARLIQLYREAVGFDPPIQHGGRGVDAYLPKRRANGHHVNGAKAPLARLTGSLPAHMLLGPAHLSDLVIW
jgi:hypothetical protein